MTGKDKAYWLSDKILAYGDYAKESADVLRYQADEIIRIACQRDELLEIAKTFQSATDYSIEFCRLVDSVIEKCESTK